MIQVGCSLKCFVQCSGELPLKEISYLTYVLVIIQPVLLIKR